MKIWGLFLFLCLWGETTKAASTCESIPQAFAPAFLDSLAYAYQPLMCSDNVLAFVRKLQKQNVDLEGAEVVVLHHKAAPYFPVTPQMARLTFDGITYLPPRWSFHVFVVVRGLVFDMDYTDSPQAVGLETYMNTMWRSSELTDFVVQIKAARDYSQKDTFGSFASTEVFSASTLRALLVDDSCADESSYEWTKP